GTAGTTLIAQSKGKGDQERVEFYLGQLAVFIFGIAFLVGIVGLLVHEPLLRLLNVPDESFEYTRQYLTITFAGIPFMFGAFFFQAAMQGIGDGVTPFLIQFSTVLFNIAIDPIFIFGWGPIPRMEVAGAAYATIISKGIATVIGVYILARGRRGMRLRLSSMKPQMESARLFVGIGMPASLGQGISAFGFTVLQGVVNSFGASVVAAFGVANRIISLVNMPAIGMSRATASLVGQSLGARDPERAKRIVRMSGLTIFGFVGIGMIFAFFYGNLLVRFFVDDAEVIGHGAILFRIVSPSVVLFALFTVILGAFEGGGDTKPVLVMHAARLWGIRVPLAVLLAVRMGMGPTGIWISMFVSNLVIAVAGFLLLRTERWMHKIDPDKL
ncbi:MAG: MATE family efflux transporter, partial [Spirochaetota bacterium]